MSFERCSISTMNIISVQTAEEGLDAPISEAIGCSSEPVLITGMENKAVLISDEMWRGIQANIDLDSIPGMQASIRDSRGNAHHELSSEPPAERLTGCLRPPGIAPGLLAQRH